MRYLCEQGGAGGELNGARAVDIRSKGGWTPLSTFSPRKNGGVLANAIISECRFEGPSAGGVILAE